MKLEGIISEVPNYSTGTNPQKYRISITGVGTKEECELINKIVFGQKQAPNKPLKSENHKNNPECGICGKDHFTF